MQKRRAQGLCFNCNEKFTAGHQCKGLQLLLLEGKSSNNLGIYEETTQELPAEKDQEEISLQALLGWRVPRTLRVIAKIGSHEIVVLIDSSSIHNFLCEHVAYLLRLLVTPSEILRCVWPMENV